MKTVIPSQTPVSELHQYILGSVAPRPIAFASTISDDGIPNLAPYSFFNAFSSNPPTLIFSSNRRVKGNTTKDTLHNVETTGEVVINIVNYDILRQMTLASIEYPDTVSEFEKAGLTPIPSKMVKPFRVKESPVQYECKVREIIPLGDQGGAGNLIICEILLIHLSEHIFDDAGKIVPDNIDLVGRMGRAFYVRANGENVFPIYQPVLKIGIGFDNLPKSVLNSPVLAKNELAFLAALENIPNIEESTISLNDNVVREILLRFRPDREKIIRNIHLYARDLIKGKEIEKAFNVMMLEDYKLI